MFSFLKKTLSEGLQKVKELLSPSSSLSEQDFNEIKIILYQNNFAPSLVESLIIKIKLSGEKPWKDVIKEYLSQKINEVAPWNDKETYALILLGINGSGKTTSSIKLARHYKKLYGKTLLVAADTFRAAAQQQLTTLANTYNIDVFSEPITDPSAVAYKACERSLTEKYAKIIIDTAGRMHQKENLLKEIQKLQKVVTNKINPSITKTLLVLDGLQGQSLQEQAKLFSQYITIDGIIVTKLDAGAKPGIIFSILDAYKIPIAYTAAGEHETELTIFDVEKFINQII
jgi:fused signal recognition particle receptor